MKLAIINASPFYQKENGDIIISADEMKSLKQWFPIFEDVTLFKPQKVFKSKDIENWILVPSNVHVKKLCDEKAGLWQKFKSIKDIADIATEYDMYYYRLPNFESLFFWFKQKKWIPYFVELHGDMESAIMAGGKPFIIKKILSICLKNVFSKMASKARFALSIGPALLEKYVKSNIPTYATTNHLLTEDDYPTDIVIKEITEPINILFVGHIHNRKGLKYLFEALKMFNQQGRKFVLRIAGKGELQEYLVKYAKENGYGEKVLFLGQIKHGPDLFELYKQSDIFVLPSIAAEGVPRVTHEAMAFCCPVIATDIGSIKWQLDGGAGLVIKPRDSNAIFNALIKLIEDDKFRKEIIIRAYNKSKLFTLEKQSEGIHKFVLSQLSEK